jgi:Phosphotransferase enzyme family
MSDSFVAFPLSRRLTLRSDAGRSARRVRLLAGTSDWRREALDRAGSAAIAMLGTRRWRTAAPWEWPGCSPSELVDELDATLPGVSILAAAAPRQRGRARLSLLGRWDGRTIVVKFGEPGDGLEVEATALAMLTDDPLPAIATPAVIATGTLSGLGDVAYLATSALGLDGQRPALDEPLHVFESDLADRLRDLPRPPDCPAEWIPTHGDLTPWNLRRTGFGLALFDWEAAGWRPAGTDLDHYRRACAALRRSPRHRSVR